jgi:nucleoside-diphosphate-sugar epimerase
VLDTFRRNALGPAGLDKHPHVRTIQGDVLDAAAVKSAMEGCDVVIHLASIAGVDTVLGNPVLTMRVSLLGTMNVLEAALAGGVKRLIDFSTSEVFGRYAYNVTEWDATTLGAVGEARWTYAVAKLATEHLAMNYWKQYQLPTVSVRPFNIYGPRQVGEGAVHHFIVRALRGLPLSIHNDGAQIRAWCYVDDIVDGIALALARDEAVGHAFNIGNPRSTLTIYMPGQGNHPPGLQQLAHRARPVEPGRRRAAHPQHRQGQRASALRTQGRSRRRPATHHLLVPEAPVALPWDTDRVGSQPALAADHRGNVGNPHERVAE